MDGYERLARAIILKAVDDYRSARKVLARNPHNIFAQDKLDQCERFFLSDWFAVLSNVDGEFILNKLKNERKGR